MPRHFLELAYNGTAYHGWQNQPKAPSVQAEVERALRLALRMEKVNAIGCGRTDSGVHATRYFAHFDAPDGHGLDGSDAAGRFVQRLNGILPEDIAIHRLIPVADDAHARFSATERGYAYHVHREKDPFLADRSHHFRPPLGTDAMNEACRALIGRKDFSSFQKTGSDVKTSICDVREAHWTAVGNGHVFRIRADRFLRNMVRAITGVCLRIGRGLEPPERMAGILAAKDRHLAGRAAPARGLHLEHVAYPFLPVEDARNINGLPA